MLLEPRRRRNPPTRTGAIFIQPFGILTVSPIQRARRTLAPRQPHEYQANTQEVRRLLRLQRAPARALELARARRRSHVALHERGNEPVQGRLPRPGEAAV